jgi:hypothetical protein
MIILMNASKRFMEQASIRFIDPEADYYGVTAAGGKILVAHSRLTAHKAGLSWNAVAIRFRPF